ncbi:GNAT family N-acetyltransferase [Maritimibacter sp. UBA3975]|uniref:GNAT family N-acetyltransferase n=1 Tax=Maritimibacter sp. UBA3975 TaxID=1946833 RepID=UPI0025BB2A93|nr:GNAT family N-acetyltransferase [Maritimibacter sp. UBA3975]
MRDAETTVVGFSDVSPDVWDAIVPEGRRKPMHLWQWAACALDAYGERTTARVILIGDPNRPDALIPLMRRKGTTGWHSLIGNEGGGVCIPCRDDDVAPRIAEALVTFGQPVALGALPAASPVIPALCAARAGKAIVIARPADAPVTPFLDLDASWCDPAVHLKKKLVQSIRRRERRLAEMGEVQMDFLRPAPEEVDAALDAAIEVEANSWKARSGSTLRSDVNQTRFVRCYAKALAEQKRLHFTFLRLDGKPIAMSIGETYGGTYWAHKTGYDEQFGKVAPGILMQYHLVAHLAETGMRRIDFQGRLDGFKRTWTEQAVEASKVRIYPFNLRGAAAVAGDVARQGRNTFRARLRKRPAQLPA